MNEIAIRLEKLSRDFENVRAVDRLSLEVPSGSIFGFLGPNGAGKTTTIHMLLGLLEPTEGRVEVLGFDAHTHGEEVRMRTGALLEHPGIYEQLSAEDNLEFYGRVWRIPEPARHTRIKELLSHIGLWERRKDPAGKWSRGMKQKLALARVLLHKPSLVLLDEPTAGLDVMSATAVREDLVSLVDREGTTVFLTTHNMSEAEKLCDRVAVIREGSLMAIGSPDELRSRATRPQVVINGSGFDSNLVRIMQNRPEVSAAHARNGRLVIDLRQEIGTAQLVNLLVEAGAQVDEIRRGKASLEEVFVSLMEEENV
jgi:ABC-2 type transport system ATP-binding protein